VEPELVSEDSGVQVYRFAAPDWIPLKVEVLERFKGDSNISTLWLGDVMSSCDLGVNAAEQWIAFLKRNADGKLTLSACNGSIRFRSSDVLKDERPEYKSMLDSLRYYARQKPRPRNTQSNGLGGTELPAKKNAFGGEVFNCSAILPENVFTIAMRRTI
jgi:hypothetical protein